MDEAKILETLREKFSHKSFRRPQGDIVSSILSGRDTLAIMPTGGGKSLCYQLPAMLMEGVTIVVSPLIALMKDQVDALSARGIPAASINSAQSGAQRRKIFGDLECGKLKLAYVSPERFRSKSFHKALRNLRISLFAVDEAHCISQWGHDFRPDYTRLGEALEYLGRPTCAAFTATATPDVRGDISEQLMLRDPAVFVSGFARPNLSFNIRKVSSLPEKFSRVCELIDKYKTGIVYCATRKSVERLSQMLWSEGIRHIQYHGAMAPSERDAAQNSFIGKSENLAVATNAFGMGIDRPDIRFVCHYEIPGSVEALYQESGRAGRDGGDSYCEVLLMYSDKRVQEFFIEGANPDAGFIRNTYRALRENSDEANECLLSAEAIAERVAALNRASNSAGIRKTGAGRANPMAVSSALSILRSLGYVERFDSPASRCRGTRILNPDAGWRDISFPPGLLEEKRRRDESKLRDVLRYAYSEECRQKWILNYFGEPCENPCGKCDSCRKDGEPAPGRLLNSEEVTEVRKVLSCVARMSERLGSRAWAPRFGREKIIKCLIGSKDEKILSSGFSRLSTYGILKERGAKFCSKLFTAMVGAKLIEISDGQYPLAGLTDFGVSVMLGERSDVKLDYPQVPSKKIRKRSTPTKKALGPGKKGGFCVASPDKPLYEALVKLRSEICASAGGIPAYKVFANQTLGEMAEKRPSSTREAMSIKGVGKTNAKKYLARFLDLIENFAD